MLGVTRSRHIAHRPGRRADACRCFRISAVGRGEPSEMLEASDVRYVGRSDSSCGRAGRCSACLRWWNEGLGGWCWRASDITYGRLRSVERSWRLMHRPGDGPSNEPLCATATQPARTLRIRCSETDSAVPSDCAKKLTRSSSSIHLARSRAAGACAGSGRAPPAARYAS